VCAVPPLGVPEGDSLYRAARELRAVLLGAEVQKLALPRRDTITDGLVGDEVRAVESRGKNLLVHFGRGFTLHVHLKMNGRILVRPQEHAPDRGGHRAVAQLDTARHRVLVLDAPVARLLRTRDVHRDLAFRELGPDLLSEDFPAEEAVRRLRARATLPLGVALMDQSALAGIGNVYKSEICFNLRLDPFGPVSRYAERLAEIVEHARMLLRKNVDAPERSVPDAFSPHVHERTTRLTRRHGERPVSVYERRGEACYDCGAPVDMRYQGDPQRSTYFCPRCQGVESLK
jgi:endonuclease VIII